jgi:hypothetical protein
MSAHIPRRVLLPVVLSLGLSLVVAPQAHADAGMLRGRVLDADTGQPLADVCLELHTSPTEWTGGGCTNVDGEFFAFVETGSYRVRFEHARREYVPEWAVDAQSYADADVFEVSDGGETVVADTSLERSSSFAGQVTDSLTGRPIFDVCAGAEDVSTGDPVPVALACTDETGHYALAGIYPGRYRIQFRSTSSKYEETWARSAPNRETADIFTVGIAETVPLDVAMNPLASISGTQNWPGGTVYAFSNPTSGEPVGWALVGTDGAYSIESLPPGTYFVRFTAGSTGLAPQWYRGVYDVGAATSITVGYGDRVTGIDADLAQGGTISGVVTDTARKPLAACVWATPSDQPRFITDDYRGCTDARGRYTISGLPTGAFKVSFGPNNAVYIPEWYNGAPDEASATPVRVTVGQNLTGINARLTLGGTISGTITDAASGQPLEGACATIAVWDSRVDDMMDPPRETSCAGPDGRYAIVGLPTGRYRVEFFDRTGNHAFEFWPDRPDRVSARDVRVHAGRPVTGIDAAMVTGGSVSGTVGPVGAGSCLVAYTAAAPDVIGLATCTDEQGHYSLRGLPTGQVKVQLSNAPEGYRTQWYDRKSSFSSADPVAATAGADKAGVDFTLDPAG